MTNDNHKSSVISHQSLVNQYNLMRLSLINTQITALLTEAIKELKTENRELKAEIETLKAAR